MFFNPPWFFFYTFLQLIPQISSLTPITTLLPLIGVLSLTALKDGYDEVVSALFVIYYWRSFYVLYKTARLIVTDFKAFWDWIPRAVQELSFAVLPFFWNLNWTLFQFYKTVTNRKITMNCEVPAVPSIFWNWNWTELHFKRNFTSPVKYTDDRVRAHLNFRAPQQRLPRNPKHVSHSPELHN